MRYARTSFMILSVLTLAACGPKAENAADNSVDRAENALSNATEATGNMLEYTAIALTPTPSPQEFIDMAAKSDAFEIAAAEIAAKNASSQEVKDFAKRMMDAHTKSTADIKKAAAAASPALTPDAALTSDQQGDLSDLRALTGVKFDKEYMDGQVDAHDDALDRMKKYAADGTAPSLKTTAGAIAPVVEQHLASAKELKKMTDARD